MHSSFTTADKESRRPMETVLQGQAQLAPEEAPSDGGGTFHAFYSWLEKLALPIGACVSLIALLRYVTYSSRRLWFDEIHTAAVALQPTWTDVWRVYCAGIDMQPPLFLYVTRASWLILGRNELAMRFPQILGVILFSWCMFFFVGKRLGFVFGLSAMILPLVTDMEFYAGEARPYGMLLGVCGLAMLAWRNAVENPRRAVALPLFATSLALMAATHAYAIVTVSTFAVGELARCIKNRRPDLRLWCCFLAVLPPLGLYWFPMRAIKEVVVGPEKWARWADFPFFYQYFFRNRLGLLVLVALLTVALAFLRKGPKRKSAGLPFHEVALVGVLAISPIFSVALAVFVTRFISARYSICAMAGIVIVAILVIDAVAPSRQLAALSLLFVAVFFFAVDQFHDAFSQEAMKTRDAALMPPFASVPPDVPIVIASGLAFLPTDMYGSDSDLNRTFYLTDRAACLKYTGSTIFELLPALQKYRHFRAHFANYRTFTREHKRFFAFGPYVYLDDWQIRKLIDDGARVVEKARYAGEFTDNFLFEVELP